ncbi:hypothetical protein IGI37_000637 [Enterococcus sp. AZ194]|uniref:DUF2314 domain-containing protein n=1 Tax=Enterococcus sp. AZ194 TaxID=2774629 RepID=UPI003F27FFDA
MSQRKYSESWEVMKRFQLDNAEQLAQEFPDTFIIPTKETRRTVKASEYVKLIFREETGHVERMWVIVTETSADCADIVTYVGTLDNDPYHLTALQCGETVYFDERHIVDISR